MFWDHAILLTCKIVLLFSPLVMSDSFATPWTVARQTPLSMEFPRKDLWSGLPFSPPGDVPDPRIKPTSPALEADSLLLSHRISEVSEIAQSYLTLCDPIDYSPPGSSVHGIFQERILEWVAISFSKGSSGPRNRIVSLVSPAMAGKFFTSLPFGKPSTFHTSLYSFHSAKTICLSP